MAGATALVLVATQLAGAEPGIVAVSTIPPVLGVPGGIDAPYGAVSCVPATLRCTAVGPGSFSAGPSLPGAGRPTVLSTDASGHWGARAALSLPSGEGDADTELTGVDCTAPGACTAVGTHLGARLDTPLAFEESSGTWQRGVAVALPGSARAGADLGAVWCASPGNCVGVGWFPRDVSQVASDPMAAIESAGTWHQAVALPAPPSGTALQLVSSVSCTDLADCTVLGLGTHRDGFVATLSWTESGGTWGPATELASRRGTFFAGVSVACASAATCVAVGGLGGDRPSPQPAAATELSGHWALPVRLPTPRLSPLHGAGVLVSVACGSPTRCVAVGYLSSGVTESDAAAATLANGSWSSMDELHDVAVPPETSTLWAVACPSGAPDCVGLGSNSASVLPGGAYRDFAARIVPSRVPRRPAPPAAVAASPDLGRVHLRWQPPPDDGGSPVASYTATLVPGGATCTTRRDGCWIGGLHVGTRYRVALADHTAAGTSNPRASASFVAGRVPGAPRALRVEVAASTIVASWAAATAPRGETVGAYVVQVRAAGRVRASCGTRGRRCAFRGLAAGTYVVSVVARDATGTSRPATATAAVP